MENIIWLNGMPRSGTSWLSQIFDSHPEVSFKLSPLFSYAFKDYVDENSEKSKWIELFNLVFDSKDEFINQNYRRNSGEYPFFQKGIMTRLVIKDTRYHNLTDSLLKLFPKIKFIHIVRHPCGTINSWLKAPKEFPQELNELDEWRIAKCRKTGIEEFWGFNDWIYLTKKYFMLQKEFPNNVKVVFYEDLVKDVLVTTKSMFDFVNLDILDQTKEFINISQDYHNNSEYSVYKNSHVMYQWKEELNPIIINEIKKDLKKNKLETYFNFD